MNRKNFLNCLVQGAVGEDLTIAILEKAGFAIVEKHCKGSDYDMKALDPQGREFTLEVKYDIKSEQTGNIAIEFFNSKKNKNSGVAVTKADFWVFVFPSGEVWIALTSNLISFLHEISPDRILYGAGDGNAGLMLYKKDIILPQVFCRIDDIVPHGVVKYVNDSLEWV